MKNVKEIVKEKYGQIANQSKTQNETSCCGVGSSCEPVDYTVFNDDYSKLEGYNEDADLGLGCGLPTQYAKIKKGDTVVDLGSGAGNDCFVARQETGPEGKVYGIDFTDAMLEQARKNVVKIGFTNVEFVKGDIEDMPLKTNIADVVVSNCVLNLVPDKAKAYKEVFRIVKPGGHFSISDVVIEGEMPEAVKQSAEAYAGCVSGAIKKQEYLDIIKQAGFKNITVQKEKEIIIPDDLINQFMSETDSKEYKESNLGIYSITVYGEKEPEAANSCMPGSGCC